jgi:rhodanese-related sulfurtransferase
MIVQLSPTEAAQRLRDVPGACLLDVREQWEWDLVRLEGACHMPMNDVPQRWQTLPDDVPVLVLCHHGARSDVVAQYLQRSGFDEVYNVRGGIDAWASEVDSSLAKY